MIYEICNCAPCRATASTNACACPDDRCAGYHHEIGAPCSCAPYLTPDDTRPPALGPNTEIGSDLALLVWTETPKGWRRSVKLTTAAAAATQRRNTARGWATKTQLVRLRPINGHHQ